MSDSFLQSLLGSLGLILLLVGVFIGILGFGDAMNSVWGMSSLFRGFAELLFGILIALLGNGIINLSKK